MKQKCKNVLPSKNPNNLLGHSTLSCSLLPSQTLDAARAADSKGLLRLPQLCTPNAPRPDQVGRETGDTLAQQRSGFWSQWPPIVHQNVSSADTCLANSMMCHQGLTPTPRKNYSSALDFPSRKEGRHGRQGEQSEGTSSTKHGNQT